MLLFPRPVSYTHLIERLLPIYLGAPGVKLGLANLVTILSLYALGLWPAVWISLARILLSGFAFGGMSSILFSLAGAALSPVSYTHLVYG